jgi:alpha-tubulin suppressor-like RCC1 family protein
LCDLVPTAVPGLAGVKAIAAGGDTTCALRDDGEVWCFGRNDKGQLGDGTSEDRFAPVRVDVEI